jgi:hypothetical protein
LIQEPQQTTPSARLGFDSQGSWPKLGHLPVRFISLLAGRICCYTSCALHLDTVAVYSL